MKNQLIIDIHTHIYPVALARRAMKVSGRENDGVSKLPIKENLLARMQEENVALSVNLPVVTKPANQTDVNRFAREVMRPNLLSFGGLHPDCEHVLEEIEKLKDMGMAGIKLHPPFQQVDLTDKKYAEMWKHINHLGFPVLIHCGSARQERPYDLYPSGVEKLIRYIPDVPVILAHMGGRSMEAREGESLTNLPENVFIDTAMSAERQELADFERLAAEFGPDRVLYGSDFPYGTQKAAIDYIRSSSFSESEKELMLGGNALKILGKKIEDFSFRGFRF